jgi:hypothetical protein
LQDTNAVNADAALSIYQSATIKLDDISQWKKVRTKGVVGALATNENYGLHFDMHIVNPVR